MDDFNRDNEKLDSALQAIRDACPVVKLLDVTTDTEAQMVEVDVSAIDFTQYQQIDIYFRACVSDYAMVNVYLNEEKTAEYYPLGNSNSSGLYSSTSNVSTMAKWRSDSSQTQCVHLDMGMPCAGNHIFCYCYSASVGNRYADINVYRRMPTSILWEDLDKVIFLSEKETGPIPSGAQITIMGVKK